MNAQEEEEEKNIQYVHFNLVSKRDIYDRYEITLIILSNATCNLS